MIEQNPGGPAVGLLPPQSPQPTGAPARRGLRVAIVVIALLALIVAVVSAAPSTVTNAARAFYPKPILGAITFTGGNTGSGSNLHVNQAVQFSVQIKAGRDLSYFWDFGDDSTSAAANPTHRYTDYSTSLTINVTVTDPIGQKSSTRLQQAILPPPPTAIFNINYQSCNPGFGCDVYADASASQAGAPDVVISTYAWSWGDGQSDSPSGAPYSQHHYDQSGSYTITLTITDQFGQTSTSSQDVSLTVPAIASFAITNSNCNSNAQACTVDVDASNSTGQGQLTYNWDWGDGTTSQSTTPQTQHSYPYQAASYTITLTVTDGTGQTSQPYQQTVFF